MCVECVYVCVFECLVVVVVSSESCNVMVVVVMVVIICPYHEHFLYTARMLYFSTYLVSSMYNSTYRLVLLLKLRYFHHLPPTRVSIFGGSDAMNQGYASS